MEKWFTIESIDNDTYAISEYGHWEQVHSYLLIGENKALLVDTGLGIGNIKSEVERLTKLPVTVVTTHVHWDHIGGHSLFKNILVHEEDAKWLEEGIPIPIEVIKKNVIGQPFNKELPKEFNIDHYKVYKGKPTKVIGDGETIDIGNRKIKVIHTPGHSPGHICLCEEERGYLYTGDLIYKGTLYAFYPTTDPLKFKKSIDKVSEFSGVKRILPSHNDLNIEVDFINKVKEGFQWIEEKGKLSQGSGLFDFGQFKIHI